MKYSNEILFVILAISLLTVSGVLVYSAVNYDDNDNDNCQILKDVVRTETQELEYLSESNDIYDYYQFSSNAYDISDYQGVISYCERSRRISQDYSQELREIKAEIPDDTFEILEVRKEMIEIEIEYLFALYEACEYMESAARAYDNENYAMGEVNIEGQNEAISKHDMLIEDYYNLQAKYNRLKTELVE